MSRNPWAYSVDYAKEIAADRSEIAELSSPLAILVGPLLVGAEWSGRPWVELWEAIVWFGPRVIEAAGLAPIEAREMLDVIDLGARSALEAYTEAHGELAAPSGERGAYARGAATLARFNDLRLPKEPIRLANLKRVRARLARHERKAGVRP